MATNPFFDFGASASRFVEFEPLTGSQLNDRLDEVTSGFDAVYSDIAALTDASAVGIPYLFSTTTADADPGAGYLRLDNATQNLATTIRADLDGSNGSTYTDVLATFDDSTSTVKGHILLQALADATKWIQFSVSALAAPSGYRNITVAVVAASAASPFADGDAVVLKFTRTGDKGDSGTQEVTLAGAQTLTNKTISGADNTLTVDGTHEVGFRHIPQVSQSAAYTLVLTDAGKHILHPSADTTARIFTIPANASVAFPIGAAVTFVNQASGGVITISITSDTMRLAGAGTTGSRTLAANGVATAIKLTATEWIISGTGLT